MSAPLLSLRGVEAALALFVQRVGRELAALAQYADATASFVPSECEARQRRGVLAVLALQTSDLAQLGRRLAAEAATVEGVLNALPRGHRVVDSSRLPAFVLEEEAPKPEAASSTGLRRRVAPLPPPPPPGGRPAATLRGGGETAISDASTSTSTATTTRGE